MKIVSQYKDSISAILSGVNLSRIPNINGAIERATRTLVQKAYIPEASGTQNITLYSGVIDYPCDQRIFGTAINDIKPQGVTRSVNDYVYRKQAQDFDRTKGYNFNGTMATFEYDNGTPIIRIISQIPTQNVTLDTMSDPTGWVLGGAGNNLFKDSTVYYKSPASLRFNGTTGVATLAKTINAINLSSYQGVGVAFLAIELPPNSLSTDLSSISIRIGSSATSYSEVTQTSGFLGSWTVGNFLLIAFDMANATNVLTPNWSVISYIQVRTNFGANVNNFRVGGLWISLPSQAQILYQSAAIFKVQNNLSTTITNDNDQIILNDSAYTLLEYEGALSVLQQTGAGMSDSAALKIEQMLNGNGSTNLGLYALYRGANPSEELQVIGSYYE